MHVSVDGDPSATCTLAQHRDGCGVIVTYAADPKPDQVEITAHVLGSAACSRRLVMYSYAFAWHCCGLLTYLIAIVQAPGKWAGNGVPKCVHVLAHAFDARGMALWGDRMAATNTDRSTVTVFDLDGVRLHTFGKDGTGPGEFWFPATLCAHPNGNLLVREFGNERVQEVTWTGEHVRFIYTGKNGWSPGRMAVSPDGSFIAVVAYRGMFIIELLDGRTCASIKQLGRPLHYLTNICFSPDGSRLVSFGCNHKPPVIFSVRGHDRDGTEFGVAAERLGSLPHIEFTDTGDVVLTTHRGGTVYSGTTLEPVRSWAWPARVVDVQAIQAHRGLLYVLCAVGHHYYKEVHVYE